MKKLLFFAALIFTVASCQEKGPGGNIGGGGEGGYVDYSDGEIALVLTDAQKVEADANGVSIDISSCTGNNVVFTCRPGANVRSYRLDVLPLAILYNSLIDGGLVGASKDEVEDYLINLLTTTSSTNGVVFTEDTFEDYLSHSYDWMNTSYPNVSILQDCDFVICAIPCFDEGGLEAAGINMCWFRTPAEELVGDPMVWIDIEVGYRGFKAVHEVNDDCKYICYWSFTTEAFDEYEGLVGERMLRDFVRCVDVPKDVADYDAMTYTVDFGQGADPNVSQTSVALALDVNGTPSGYLTRKDFTLKPIPESTEAEYEIRPAEAYASIFYIDVDFEPSCRACRYRFMTPEAAAEIQAYTDEQKRAYAYDLVNNGGWYVGNPGFEFDEAGNMPSGTGAVVKENHIVATDPQPEYVIVSVGLNYYGELSGLQFSEPVVMKPRVTDNPSACLVNGSNFRFTLENPSRTGFTYKFEYDKPEDIALYYFQIVHPVDAEAWEAAPELCPPADIYNATREEWMHFFFETTVNAADGEPVLQVNTWYPEISGRDQVVMFGYTPETRYVCAYCVEDINGVVGEVGLVECTTASVNPSDNPRATIDADLKDDTWRFTFSANEDTGTLKYMTSSYGDANYVNLGLSVLLKDQYDDFPYQADYLAVWRNSIMANGLPTQSLTTYATEAVRTDGTPILALCLPIGEDADGNPVYGEMQHLIIHDNQIKTIKDFREQ